MVSCHLRCRRSSAVIVFGMIGRRTKARRALSMNSKGDILRCLEYSIENFGDGSKSYQ